MPRKSTTKSPAKKTTKKTPAKKKSTAKKKVTKKSPAKKKDLTFANGEMAFWVTNGKILNSLLELLEALEHMEEEHYEYHAAGDQNDFSVWVEEVLCDGDCSVALGKAKNKKDAHTIVKRHLKVYNL